MLCVESFVKGRRFRKRPAIDSENYSKRAQLEWSPETVASGRLITPALYAIEPGLHEARSADFDGLRGFLADSLPEGWGALMMKRRLAKLGVRWDLTGADRLALVGRQGRRALIYEPATAPAEDGKRSISTNLPPRRARSCSRPMGEAERAGETGHDVRPPK